MPHQFSFDLRSRPSLERGDFFVSSANEQAIALIDQTEAWPSRRLVLTGPRASGKSHLAHVWAAQNGAPVLAAKDLADADLPALSAAPLALDDADTLAGDAEGERLFFHLYNMLNAEAQPFLITAQCAPASWGLKLPDLASRMEATGRAELLPPDDALLSIVLMKQLAERQLDIDPDVIDYATTHMERSFAAARALAEALNQAAFSKRRKITKPLVREVLQGMGRDLG